MSFRIRLIPALAAAALLAAAATAHAAPPSGDNPFGVNKRLHDVLQENRYFKGVPDPRRTVCRVRHENRPLAIFEHVPLAPGVLGTVSADFTRFDATGNLIAAPDLQSGAFGGLVPLKGPTAVARDFSYSGDSMFPLMTGKSWKMSLHYADSRLEYSCQDLPAPASFKIHFVSDDNLHLVRCERRTVRNSGDWTPEKSAFALCSHSLRFCPLTWIGEEGHKGLFEHYTVGGEKFAPVRWECQPAN